MEEAKSSVKVAVRVRPLIGQEKINNEPICISVNKQDNEICMGTERRFTFDTVFSMTSRQEEVFNDCVNDLVGACFDGYNATILAYGQTGSGKTHTMGSGQRLSIPEEDLGIIPRVIQKIFGEVEERKEKAEFILKVSFLEIYNEEIHDLLEPKHTAITIREDKGQICLMGLHEERVESYEEMASCLDKGSFNRSTASTLMNLASSRSHGIFTISVEQHIIEDLISGEAAPEGAQEYMMAKFHFVDLAGSERAKRTGATGSVLKEGININKGLLCLGNVISALTEPAKKAMHVPYRDSKLTRILQDSLGGNSKTYMIACVSPAEINFEETLNALKYASRARRIQNKPMVNRDPNSIMLAQLRQEVFELKQEIRNYQTLLNLSGNPEMAEQLKVLKASSLGADDESKNLKLTNATLEKQVAAATADLEVTRTRLSTVEIDIMVAKRERDTYKAKYESCLETMKEHGIDIAPTQDSDGTTKLIEEYTETIEKLQKENQEKERVNRELSIEYESLMKQSERDSRLLEKLNEELETTRREMGRKVSLHSFKIEDSLMESVDSYGRLFVESIKANFEMDENDPTAVDPVPAEVEALEQPEPPELPLDEDYPIVVEEADAEATGSDTEDEIQKPDLTHEHQALQAVVGSIKEKEELLRSIEETFKDMQGQLLTQMTEQYHTKIAALENEIRTMESEKDMAVQKASQVNEKNAISEAYKKKISQLEVKLQQSKKSDREQAKLHQLVENQKKQITKLADEIKQAKVTKVQLTKKIKQEQDNFTRMKAERNREMIQMKRRAFQKDQQILKLQNETRKKEIIVKRKIEELRAYQKRSTARASKNQLEEQVVRRFISEYTSSILAEEELKAKLRKEVEEKNQIADTLLNYQKSEARAKLRRDRALLQLDDEDSIELRAQIAEDEKELEDINESIETLEEKLAYKEKLIIEKQNKVITSDVQTLKAKYLNISNIKDAQLLAGALFDELLKHAEQERGLKGRITEKEQELEQSRADAEGIARQLTITQAAMLNMEKEFDEKCRLLMAQKSPIVPVEDCESEPRPEDQTRIDDLTSQLDRLTSKYSKLRHSWRDLKERVEKPKEQEVVLRPRSMRITNLNAARDLRKMGQVEEEPHRYSLDDTGLGGWGRLRSATFSKPKTNPDRFPNVEKWKCVSNLDISTGSVCSMVSNENMLFTGSNKTFKAWSLESMSVVSEVPAHTSFIKAMDIIPDRQILLTSCDRVISLWDMISLQNSGKLLGHKDQIRALHYSDPYLFSAGKGSQNAGSLFIWDLRMQNTPIEEREKGMEDLFTLYGDQTHLYYGGKNHKVGRMTVPEFEVEIPFEPPHYDTVTSIKRMGDSFLSASRDKNIKRWDADGNETHNIMNAHQDWINALETDAEESHLYSAAKDGKIRIWRVKNVLECSCELALHQSSVNCLARI